MHEAVHTLSGATALALVLEAGPRRRTALRRRIGQAALFRSGWYGGLPLQAATSPEMPPMSPPSAPEAPTQPIEVPPTPAPAGEPSPAENPVPVVEPPVTRPTIAGPRA